MKTWIRQMLVDKRVNRPINPFHYVISGHLALKLRSPQHVKMDNPIINMGSGDSLTNTEKVDLPSYRSMPYVLQN